MENFAKARPASEVLLQIFGAKVAKEMLKPRGRPRVELPKERINIRLSPCTSVNTGFQFFLYLNTHRRVLEVKSQAQKLLRRSRIYLQDIG